MPKRIADKKARPGSALSKTVGARPNMATRGTKNNMATKGKKPPGKHMKRGGRRSSRY